MTVDGTFDFASLLRENPSLVQTALSALGSLGGGLSSASSDAPPQAAVSPLSEKRVEARGKSAREVLFSGIRPYLGERSARKLEAARVFVLALESLSGTLGKGDGRDVSDPG